MAEQVLSGKFTNGVNTVEVQGSFNGWTSGLTLTNDPSIILTNQYGLASTDVYDGYFSVVSSPAAACEYKYVIQPQDFYESPSAANGVGYVAYNNRFFANVSQALPLVHFSDAPYAPLDQVTFSVDMSAQLLSGTWTPGDGVFCTGVNSDWATDSYNVMTNNPAAGDTNVYYATFTIGQGATTAYKFAYVSGYTVYESPSSTGGNNRFLTIPAESNFTLPTVYFNDLDVNTLLFSNVNVTFSVDMSHAVEYGTGIAFDPSADVVFVNAAWIDWPPWIGIALQPYQLTNNPFATNPNIYSGTFSVPVGNSISMTYKYGFDDGIDSIDNEAPEFDNHVRVIRSLSTGSYQFPTDTFGDQYVEPTFGELSLGENAAGSVQLSWLGAPNVLVQTATNLTRGPWVSQAQTSGTFWSAGVSSTNGLISVTNWPAGNGSAFFRLIQQ